MLKVIRAKFHGIRVTGADLNYHGSISLDPIQCRAAGFYPMEFVEIWNKTTGARISTYIIFGEEGSRCCILNGAAARTCQQGDELIIAASASVRPEELPDIKPRVLTFNEHNEIQDRLMYVVSKRPDGGFDFETIGLNHELREDRVSVVQ